MADARPTTPGNEFTQRNRLSALSAECSSARPRGTVDLVQYLAEFQLTLADLEPQQVAMFVAARNSAGYVKDLEIPVASWSRRDEGDGLQEKETESPRKQSASYSNCIQTRVPENEMSIGQIRGVEDLPQIFPAQWLLEETCSPVFYSKLADYELIMPYWERPTGDVGNGDDLAWQRQFLHEHAAAQFTRQHAYVLLDVSRSMNDRDRRGIVARGLALAFLLHGWSQQAELQMRPFTADVSELSHGGGKSDFCAITRRVVELANSGQTRIQPALEQATSDIRKPGPCYRADILLITDGISRLSRNPLVGEKLHTFILGNLKETNDPLRSFATLKGWSQTYHHIRPPQFGEILAPLACDVQAAAAVLEQAVRELENGTSVRSARELRRISDNVRALLQELHRVGDASALPQETREAIERQLQRVRQTLSRMPARSASRHGGGFPHARRFGAWWTAGLGRTRDEFGDHPRLWHYLRQWIFRLGRWFWDGLHCLRIR
jgi:hypothetical protein